MKIIESRQNPEVKGIVALHERKNRTARSLYIAEGLRVCTTLLKSGQKLKQFYVTYPMLDAARDLVGESLVTVVSPEVMEKISGATSPSGMVGVFVLPAHQIPDAITRGVVLARISDPGNMGTLIRTCAALGHTTVAVVEGTDPWSPKVIQASAGTIGMVNLIPLTWHELMARTEKSTLCALVVNDGQTPEKLDLKNSLLMIGNEAHGIPEDWINASTSRMTIAMPGNTESLNAAVAGSIALYIAATQQ